MAVSLHLITKYPLVRLSHYYYLIVPTNPALLRLSETAGQSYLQAYAVPQQQTSGSCGATFRAVAKLSFHLPE